MSEYEEDYYEEEDYDNEYKNDIEENLNNDVEELNDQIETFFRTAKNSNDYQEAIDNYNMVIEMEMSNSQSRNFSYQSYENLCLINIKQKDVEKFTNSFSQIQSLISSSLNNIDEKLTKDTLKKILEEIDKFPYSEYKYKESFINILYEKIINKNINQFFLEFRNYINNNKELSFNENSEENKRFTINIIYPTIPMIYVKKFLKEDKLLQSKKIQDLKSFILTPLSNGKFIYYLETKFLKTTAISDRNYFTNEIIINNPYECYEIKQLLNNDIVLCLEKETKMIRCNFNENTYEVIQIFDLPILPYFSYCVELSDNKIALGYQYGGFSIWNKINDKYQCINSVIRKGKIFPVDNKTYLIYCFKENNYDCEIEIRFYDLESLNFFGKIFINLGNILYKGSIYRLNQRDLKFLKLGYLQKYILIIACQDSIWILDLKQYQIIYTLELKDIITQLFIQKDGSFTVVYDDVRVSIKQKLQHLYVNYFFDGEKLIKRWEGKSDSNTMMLLDNLDFVFVFNDNGSDNVEIKINHMKYGFINI
jgi:hypothetical protein